MKSLQEMNVKQQAYHSNSFVGNHCVIILKKYKDLTKTIKDWNSDMQQKLDDIFSTFSGIVKLMMIRKAFLNEKQILDLKSLIFHFGLKFKVYFPNRSITRQVHELIFYIPRFVTKHKTIGIVLRRAFQISRFHHLKIFL